MATLFPIEHFNFGYELFKSLHFSWDKLKVDGDEVKKIGIANFTLGELSV
ncbi:hypothetical protein [Psychroflexus sp. MES1-P1E]|nr:hypothetical protein [Psychroflexus sp. MES1-P1E]